MRIKTLFNVVRSKVASLRYPYFRAKYKVDFRNTRIKLVAVAKNESAYIPEWVYHHLFYGFDHIDIHYNGCTDNTVALAEQFNDDRVTFVNADPVFKTSKISPQMDIYRPEFAHARRQGFDHVMFLDIDEFWVPFDLCTTIKDHIQRAPYFDSMCFQWANKVDEAVQFARAISPQIQVEPARQLKSIHKSFISPGLMNPHNVIDNSLVRLSANGSVFTPSNEHHSMAPVAALPDKAFILHRKYRSQMEYVALLGRGRPIGPDKVVSEFKNNRDGYYAKSNSQLVAFGIDNFTAYDTYMTEQLSRFENSDLAQQSKASVINRFYDVIEAIKNAPKEEQAILTKILRNVEIEDVQLAFEEFKRRHS